MPIILESVDFDISDLDFYEKTKKPRKKLFYEK
jgi:hypothetical protein